MRISNEELRTMLDSMVADWEKHKGAARTDAVKRITAERERRKREKRREREERRSKESANAIRQAIDRLKANAARTHAASWI